LEISSAWRTVAVVLALTKIACLQAITELTVVAVGIDEAFGLDARVVLFDATLTFRAWVAGAFLALVIDACLQAITELVVVAVGIDEAFVACV
jgi:hypothetical protein